MTFHLHLDSRSAMGAAFHLTPAIWEQAAARHPELARQVEASFGWDAEALPAALRTADAIISSKFDKSMVNAAPRLRWIHTTAAGVDALMPLNELREDLFFTNSSGVHVDKAGEFAAMALLMLNARMPEVIANQHAHVWDGILTAPIRGKKTLVVGFGDIGQAVARSARMLGTEVVAVSRTGKASAALPEVPVVTTAELDAQLPTADFVVVTTPLTAQTRGMLDARRLGLLPSTAGFVNMARAPVVDYDALFDMLRGDKLAGAVLDVFTPEPIPEPSPTWNVPRLVVTPHISCDAPDYALRVLDLWFDNFARLLAGEPLRNVVDRERGY